MLQPCPLSVLALTSRRAPDTGTVSRESLRHSELGLPGWTHGLGFPGCPLGSPFPFPSQAPDLTLDFSQTVRLKSPSDLSSVGVAGIPCALCREGHRCLLEEPEETPCSSPPGLRTRAPRSPSPRLPPFQAPPQETLLLLSWHPSFPLGPALRLPSSSPLPANCLVGTGHSTQKDRA